MIDARTTIYGYNIVTGAILCYHRSFLDGNINIEIEKELKDEIKEEILLSPMTNPLHQQIDRK